MDGQEKQVSLPVRILRFFRPHWKIIRDGFPLALYSFLAAIPIISLPIFGGHQSLGSLNVVALFMATDFTLMSNVNFACGFAFQGPVSMAVGARDSVLVRRLLQRALVSGSIVYVCVTVFTLAASYWVFLLVGQPHIIALQTLECLAIAGPAELVWVFITLVTRTMIAQHMIWIVVGCGAFFAIIGVAAQFLAYWLNTGAIGLAVSYTIASILTGFFVAIITLALRAQREWILEWTRESFTELWEMSWLFIKSVIYQFAMRLFIEVGTIVISILGPIDLAAQFILMRYGIIVLVTGMGFWSAAVAIMGRAAGAGKRSKFVTTFIANLMLFVVIAVLTFLLLFFFSYPLAYLSTSIVAVQKLLGELTPCMGVFSAVLLLWIGSHSLVLSLGRVNVPTVATVFSEFIVGIPLAMVLTFGTPLKLWGFYIGLLVSYSCKFVILWTYYACTWNELMSTISDSDTPNSELSPFLPKMNSEDNTQTKSIAPEIVTESTNGYGTAESSNSNDPYQTTNKQ